MNTKTTKPDLEKLTIQLCEQLTFLEAAELSGRLTSMAQIAAKHIDKDGKNFRQPISELMR